MLRCESCGCPYVTNAPDGDIRFVMPPSDKTENRRLRTLLGRCVEDVKEIQKHASGGLIGSVYNADAALIFISEKIQALLADLEKEGLGGEGESRCLTPPKS